LEAQGLSASTFSLLFNHFITQNPHYAAHVGHSLESGTRVESLLQVLHLQGASGATYGTIAFFAAAMPRATFLLFFGEHHLPLLSLIQELTRMSLLHEVIPVPAWVRFPPRIGSLFSTN